MRITPYLNFNGDCRDAFTRYQEIFGGKIQDMLSHADFPMEGNDVSPEWRDKILHAHLVLDGYEIMGSDCPPDSYTAPRNMYVAIQLTDPSEAERIYRELEDGAKGIEMPLGETPWATRFGMLTDRFGIPWMINCGES